LTFHWHDTKDELNFESETLTGTLVADCGEETSNNRHHIKNLIHNPTGTRVTPEGGMMQGAGSFTLFRVLARSSWLTELRATRPSVERKEDGAILIWEPTIKHQVKTTADFSIKDPNIIDIDISIEGYAYYPDYELLCSNYVSEQLSGGLFVRQNELSDEGGHEKILVTDNAAFHGMYNFFPRDEYAAHIMTDGRGQKGRWYWRLACGRRYACPLGFATDGQVDVLFMGRPEDVYAVGATYAADAEHADGVARHHALYLSLFGRDLHPGDGRRTQVRLVVDGFMNQEERLLGVYEAFLSDVADVERTFEVKP
jgi:hypothetical protein